MTVEASASQTPVAPEDDPTNEPAPTRAAIFDLDGTLADTMPVHYRVWIDVAARYGIDFPEETFYAMGGIPTPKIAALLAAQQGLTFDPLRVAREKEQMVLGRVSEVMAIPAVVEIARRCRLEGPIAIASGGSRAMVESTLRQIGIYDWFPVIVTAEDTTRHKPDPDVFLEAARRMGVTPEICTVYEDSDVGLEAARRAGMRAVDVRPLYQPTRIKPRGSA